MQKVLITCKHGLGDAAQITIILQHIKAYRPDWQVDMLTTYGKHSCFFSQCNRSLIMGQDHPDRRSYNKVINLLWDEPRNSIRENVPATKPTVALVNEMQIEPDPSLFHYKINVPFKSRDLARRYVESLPQNNGIILVHYEGNSSGPRKNIHPNAVRLLANHFIKFGYLIIILDWDYRSSLIKENSSILCPNVHNPIWEAKGTGNAATIAALIGHAKLFVGIDSGPLHIAGATRIPTIGIWTNNHPAHFYDLADNVTHLIPYDARRYIRGGSKDRVIHYFEKNYQYGYYGENGLAERLLEMACELLVKPTVSLEPPITFEEGWPTNISRLLRGQWWMIGSKPGATVF